MKNSYFDAGLFSYVMNRLIGIVITIFSFGILFPWVICHFIRWETKHTVIDGKRLYFDGTAMQLFFNWLKWLLLIYLTLGIYSFWGHIKVKKWVIQHTHFVA